MKYFLQSFGCKSNQYESQAIREMLDAAGFAETESLREAGLYLINTCGVTGRAVASCRNALRKAARANPDLVFVVTGCGVDLREAWPELPHGDPVLVPNAKKHALVQAIQARLAEREPEPAEDDAFALSISSFHGHTRAFLKIQDGCANRCAYCAVPLARGEPRSRPHREILDEAARLIEAGHGELVLTGINIGVYRDPAMDFADLVAALAETPGLIRLRLGSVEPPQVTERLAQAMGSSLSVCPHLHMPLQSGSDRVLAAMGRRYTAGDFLDKAAMLRESLVHPALTTDVIVGFPGEGADDFQASAEACRRAGFSRLHVFLFSPRRGTPAAGMRRTVPDRVIEGWKRELIALGERLALDYAAGCRGLIERVIVEKTDGGTSGLCDRYVTVRLSGAEAGGAPVRVRIVRSIGTELVGDSLLSGESPLRWNETAIQ